MKKLSENTHTCFAGLLSFLIIMVLTFVPASKSEAQVDLHVKVLSADVIFLDKSSKSIFRVLGSISTHLIFKLFAKTGQLVAVQVKGVHNTSSPSCNPGQSDSQKISFSNFIITLLLDSSRMARCGHWRCLRSWTRDEISRAHYPRRILSSTW